jgi:hypothetical protein
MKSRVLLTAVCILTLVLFPGIAGAAERVLIPDEMDLPWYAAGLGHSQDGAWVASVFYRPLDTVPEDALVSPLTFYYDIDSEACPLRVEGFAVFEEGASLPISSILQNRPGEVVEICFISREDFVAANKDGKVTVGETRKMPSLVVGLADFYLEVNQPPDPGAPGVGFNRTVIASGVLEHGRPFSVRSVSTSGAYNHDFWFGD